jgi:fructokinase
MHQMKVSVDFIQAGIAGNRSGAMKQSHLILGLGELLWDLLPAGAQDSEASVDQPAIVERLGGAPANFALMAARLGDHAAILSRIGRDDLGRKAMARLEPLSADHGYLQVDPVHETGRVTVTLEEGQPSYTIHQPAAWDFLELSDEWVQLVERADAICFGSLAQRSPVSRQTIQELVAQSSSECAKIFDVNLRAPFYSVEVLQESLELATVVKMNHAEMAIVMESLGMAMPDMKREDGGMPMSKWLRACAKRLLAEFPALQMVAVTRGRHGSLLQTREEWHEHPGFAVQMVDAIGAGDAFTAAMTHYLLRGADLATMNNAGNRWGSWMATQSGAMPVFAKEERDEIIATIEG